MVFADLQHSFWNLPRFVAEAIGELGELPFAQWVLKHPWLLVPSMMVIMLIASMLLESRGADMKKQANLYAKKDK